MTIYKIKTNLITKSYICKKPTFLTVENVKIRKDNKDTKSHFFEFLINQVPTGINTVYDRGYRDNLHQFQCHTM